MEGRKFYSEQLIKIKINNTFLITLLGDNNFMRKSSFKKGVQFILLNFLLIFSLIIVQTLIQEGPLYSKPAHVSAEFNHNILRIDAVPEVWNPSIVPLASGNNFKIVFQMHIFTNTKSITYTKEVMQTLEFYPSISPGLNDLNTFIVSFNFSYDFSNKFNQGDLFIANISIDTVSIIPSQTSISGTTVLIQNNDLTTILTHQKTWGGIILVNNTVVFESIVLIGLTAGIYYYKTKMKTNLTNNIQKNT